jgi:hypothetical protein
MKRRDFIRSSLGTTAAATCMTGVAAVAAEQQTASGEGSDWAKYHAYEWRTYRLSDKSKQSRIHDYLRDAVIPTWERQSMGPVGVFTEIGPEAGPSIHVLLVYPSMQAVATTAMILDWDPEYLKAAADYRAIKKEDPAFDRIESWLMLSFLNAPKINVPERKPRVFELRTYESFSEERARAKVAMFNDGEIGIFPKCGFENVFFGECFIGSGLPCLKYMLAAPDMPTNEVGWKKFLEHPEFVKMKDDPKYVDTVSKITKLFLEPTDYSQI